MMKGAQMTFVIDVMKKLLKKEKNFVINFFIIIINILIL
jgi:hypothetical protein